ncbi:GMC family oxidoreductase [Flaviaesturariibacter flavus]|uniref:GMC family oxidoreductase n=1 Tax=Flaviaesturariibacter flavus TaxID=2502780 RepID=A0A4R1BQ10_9BACT|nr:GMC family oxidoreductase [Flaviaesturariibacter flavus]TCJ19608.1 GMC family oxidoreductase [Flaviaesturariibacter flavus]
MSEHLPEYDVVIVGSGISGAIMAKTLTRAGRRVLLLEAGLKAGIALTKAGSYRTYQEYLNTFYMKAAKVPNSPYPNLPVAPSSDVLDIRKITNPAEPSTAGYLVQKGPVPFASDNMRGPGGTTMHWLGSTPRMLPNDFRMQSLYGAGVDWPISYDDLKHYYELAENEIGVAGDVDAQRGPGVSRANYGSGYVFPMEPIPQSYLDKQVMAAATGLVVRVGDRHYPLEFVPTPQGRNAAANPEYAFTGVRWEAGEGKEPGRLRLVPAGKGRHPHHYAPIGSLWDPYTGQRCEGNSSCVPICPVQAKYNALKTLQQADAKLLEIRTQAVASRVLLSEDGTEVTGIEYKTYSYDNAIVYETAVAKGKYYVLGCSAIENAKLLLASGAANSSDQVGRNLMDHLVMLTWGLFPQPVYPYRGPGSTTNIPTFRDGTFRKEHAAWISPIDNWGWSYPGIGTDAILQQKLEQGLYGKALREAVSENISRQLLVHFEIEQAPHPENRVTIDPQYRDQLGNYKPVIQYSVTGYEQKAFEAAWEVSRQLFNKMGVDDQTDYNTSAFRNELVTWKGRLYNFWGAGHIVGTHRMGSRRSDSVVDHNGRTWDHSNLYLVGCGNMPTLGTSNPTLTMAALTFKTAENILQELEKNKHVTTVPKQQPATA